MSLMSAFEERMIDGNGARIRCRVGGQASGGGTDGKPGLLLLHGYPQTGVMWHPVAPLFAETHVVVCPDLRGYGGSEKPAGGPDHGAYSKRAMAADMVAVMASLGFERFTVFGHDRGGRVTHRLCLDYPDRVEKAAVLDIIPTHTLYRSATQAVASAYYHWYFFIQPEPLPETLIGADPEFYLDAKFGGLGGGLDFLHPDALAEYRRYFRDPATIHASCEDYRAGATIDLAHDEADFDARIACPLLVLWGSKGPMGRHYDVPATWREKAADVSGGPIDAGHFLIEENPTESYAALRAFLDR